MDWLADNWGWMVFVILMLAMHLFGHGGHGSHRGHGRSEDKQDQPGRASRPDSSGHHH